MTARVHPSAVVDSGAVIGENVEIGPCAYVGAEVEIGDGTTVGAGAYVQGPARIGRENRIAPHACIGTDPQDLKFAGERVAVEIGDRNQIREFVTIHRGTGNGGGLTRIGSDCLLMVYSHVAHDCQVGDRVIFANNATLAGHCEVHDDATVGAFSAIQPFGRIGRHAYVGGYTRLLNDALPFVKTSGLRPVVLGVNRIGLQRKGWTPERVRAVSEAMRVLLRSGLNTSQALERLSAAPASDDIGYLVDFVRAARRGVVRTLPGRGSDEDAGGDA
jgi:UDP-N-acetylglucosamine acyltransferase